MALWQWQHPPGQTPLADAPAIVPVAFSDIPGWAEDDHEAAFSAFLASASLPETRLPAALKRAVALVEPGGAKAFFETHFKFVQIAASLEDSLLTAYFEPEIEASLERSAAYNHPIYSLPPDLELAEPGDRIADFTPPFTAGVRVGGRLEPYYTRGEIEDGALDGQGLELAYAADPIDLFVMHVQGGGLLKLEDGEAKRVSFAGKNGHPYASIGKALIERGVLAPENATLDVMLEWLRANAAAASAVMRENKSYIFFEALPEDESVSGPRGSLGAPLTPMRSLACDPAHHRLGLPIWVGAPSLEAEGAPFRRLMIAQDTGSAIRGAARGDVYWGAGAKAGLAAGRVKHACAFTALLPIGDG